MKKMVWVLAWILMAVTYFINKAQDRIRTNNQYEIHTEMHLYASKNHVCGGSADENGVWVVLPEHH